ncbi:Asp-tRNA(Asn)/Glu-tRNA(Gln) amidotransferase GatCAB subunit B [Candidatus Collierbacteria bacterium CG10_big_fil_rev_8_21_14_0_10_44_9]|uniref:Aspartyl/glutamyl-tRNA(Asn/Gln) amidotransferase subunit B n=1 Tax=Candidatus Collierbacteria bacterium CG10_big_fil_rev_8_21_14_0_10_44_9 TaxID=1974535 RepID=A0A2H0VJR2_9BACT|nr:MAG: Asp-tRNA(Asn)/Glu-tRNA(Gln) amidotransferase GatCAB subunit B [Candidatus Collierbacteria bacterium CG10_big_fil_rev_8_21_14_0_10_44_9]
MTYQLICGAEIHVELKTKSKMFCGCKNDPFHAAKPNIYTCPVCLGMPGALPVPNKQAIEDCILIGLALGCKIAKVSKFDRKHYFYPDLPKGYQISQYDEPFCFEGLVKTSFGPVRITRVHMEEDTAKMHHETVDGKKVSLIDFNRSSVPLVEIVTEPDIKSPEQAKEFLKKVRDIIRTLGVADCDMEKGGMRLEANISLSRDLSAQAGGNLPNYKVEVKNINSFRFFANALTTEFARHSEILDRGEVPVQETRGYRSDTSTTVSQRVKEDAADYRYFPDPDIPPIVISNAWLTKIKSRLPELPTSKIEYLIALGVVESTAKIIVANQVMMEYLDQVKTLDPKMVSQAAKDLVNKKVDYQKLSPEEYLKTKSVSKITDKSILRPIIEKILSDNPIAVADYKAGKQNAFGFFVGAVIKATSGQADPKTVHNILTASLSI